MFLDVNNHSLREGKGYRYSSGTGNKKYQITYTSREFDSYQSRICVLSSVTESVGT